MDMTLQHLRLLREVSRRGTIAAAADALGYTPSAVSQQLAGLEKSAGVAVLERVGRNVHLTDAGRELVRHAGDLLAGMEAAKTAVERINNEARGDLEISVYESVASTLLVPLLDRLAENYPDLHILTRETDPDEAIDAIAAGELDLAFTMDYPHAPAAPQRNVDREAVFEDRFYLIVPEDDPLGADGIVDLAAAADRPFVASPEASCGRCVVSACRAAGFEPNIVHRLDDYPTTLRLVAAGRGVALVPALGLIHTPDGLKALCLTTPVSRQVQLAYRPTSAERPSILAVRTTLTELIADLRDVHPDSLLCSSLLDW